MPGDNKSSESSLNENSSDNGKIAKGTVGQQDKSQRSRKNRRKRRKETKSQDESDKQNEGSIDKRPRRNTRSVKYVYNSSSDNNENENDDTSAGFEEGFDGESQVFDDAPEERDSKKAKTSKDSHDASSVNQSSARATSIAAAIMAIPVKKRERKTAWVCIRCGKVFKSSVGLQYHIDKLVCMEEDIASKFKCKVCKKVFKSETGLQHHVERRVCIRKAERAKIKKAQPPPKKKASKEKKAQPEKEAQPEKKAQPEKTENFKCPHCDKGFKTQGGLQYHVDKRVCIYLDGTFKKKGPPEKERRSLEKFEDLTCPHCKRIFKSLDGVKYHVRKFSQEIKSSTVVVVPIPTLS